MSYETLAEAIHHSAPEFIVISKEDCEYCDKAKKYLADKGATWKDFDYTRGCRESEYMFLLARTLAPNISTFPIIFRKGHNYVEVVNGYHGLLEEDIE